MYLHCCRLVLSILALHTPGISMQLQFRIGYAYRISTRPCISGIQHIHFRYHAITENVDEYMRSMGSAEFLCQRIHLPSRCHGPFTETAIVVVPNEKLLHDLSDEHPAWLPCGIRVELLPCNDGVYLHAYISAMAHQESTQRI